MYVRMIGGLAKTTYCEQVTISSVKPILRTDMYVAESHERDFVLADQMAVSLKVDDVDFLKDDGFDIVRAVQGVIIKEVVNNEQSVQFKSEPRDQEKEGEVVDFGFVDQGFSVGQLEVKFPVVDRRVKKDIVPFYQSDKNVVSTWKGMISSALEIGVGGVENSQDEGVFPFDSSCPLDEYVSSNSFSQSEYVLVTPVVPVLVGEASRSVRCTKCFKVVSMSVWKSDNVSKILCYECLNSKRFKRNPDLVVRCSDCSVKMIINVNCTLRQFTKKHPRCSACVDSQLRGYCLPRLDVFKVNLDFCCGDFSIDVDRRPVFDFTHRQMDDFRRQRLLQFNSLLKVVGFQISEPQKNDFVFSKTINEMVLFVWEHKHFWMEDSSLVNWLKALGPGYARWGDGPSNYSELIKRVEGCPRTILDYACGSGHGVSQIRKSYPFADCRGYDLEDLVDPDLGVVCETVISSQFDAVLLNNVLHHIVDLDSVYDDFLSLIGPCTQVLIKDHCATNENLFLLVLVHICYLGGEIERMVFRSSSVIEDYFSSFGIVCSVSFLGNVYNDMVLNFSADL